MSLLVCVILDIAILLVCVIWNCANLYKLVGNTLMGRIFNSNVSIKSNI